MAGEHPRGHQLMIGLFVVYIIIWILDSFIFRLTALVYIIPFFVNIIFAIIIVILSLWLASKSDIVFEGSEPRVVDTGPYARVRHPMYLGMVLVHVGIWITTLSLLALVPLIAVFIGYNYLANDEEHRLEAQFGDEYLAYKKRVRKWIPL
jgi:protein-S-isoprenylcysteine O-methyltransferase Ste14